jgi:hypothetical protein
MSYFIVIDKNGFSSPAIAISQEERYRQTNTNRAPDDKWTFKFFDTEEEVEDFKRQKQKKYPAVAASNKSKKK